MKTRRLKVVAKGTDFCPNLFNCPTIAETEEGTYIVQGKKLDRATRRSLKASAGGQIPAGEDAVEIPAELIHQLVRDLNV